MVEIQISIIIPIYNVEEYLVVCLESVRRNITGLEAEVLLIDDGSTDASSVIAGSYAKGEENFFYYRKENGGLSSARNYGVSLASGKYLFFVDSDDMLADGILPKMIESAERNGTELTVCHVARLKGNKISESYLHPRAFNSLRDNISHIKNHPNFVYDSTAWNKLILRSFYIKCRIVFPEGYLYEDMLPMFKLHYLCNGVSVVRETGYLWRIRTGINKSITASKDKQSLTDKIEMMRQVLAYIEKNVKESEIEETVVIKFLGYDFNAWLNQIRLLSEEEAKEHVQLIREFADHPVNKRNLHKLPLLKQQLYQDIFENDFPHLLQLVNYMNANYANVPILETGSGIALKVPYHLFKIKERDASGEFDNHELPSGVIDRVTIDGADIYLQGHLYIRRINIPYTGHPYVKAFLLNEYTGSMIPLTVSPIQTADLTKSKGYILNYDDYTYYQYDYDGAGFQLHIDFEKIAQELDCAVKYYVILSYDFKYFSGDWLLKGIAGNAKKALEQYVYKSDLCTGSIVFDSQNIISLKLMDNKETEVWSQVKQAIATNSFNGAAATGIQELMIGEHLLKYITARIDIKNLGTEENVIVVTESSDPNAKIQNPAWFKNETGQGTVVQSTKGSMKLEIKCIGDGVLKVWLRGIDCRDRNSKRFPVWIDFTRFSINDKCIFTDSHVVWHDKPFVFKTDVIDGENIRLEIGWKALDTASDFTT